VVIFKTGNIIFSEAMGQRFNKSRTITKTKGPVWSIKVEVCPALTDSSNILVTKVKHWKIKEILN